MTHIKSHRRGSGAVKAHTRKHMGFKAVAKGIAAREGLPMDRARAILAASARKASAAAHRSNPRLASVKG